MHPSVGAIHDVDISAIVDLDVICLDSDFAALIRSCADAALVRLVGDRRNVISDLFGMKRIANIESANSGVEVRDENDSLVKSGSEILVGRMGAKTPAAIAEVSAGLGNRPGGY